METCRQRFSDAQVGLTGTFAFPMSETINLFGARVIGLRRLPCVSLHHTAIVPSPPKNHAPQSALLLQSPVSSGIGPPIFRLSARQPLVPWQRATNPLPSSAMPRPAPIFLPCFLHHTTLPHPTHFESPPRGPMFKRLLSLDALKSSCFGIYAPPRNNHPK